VNGQKEVYDSLHTLEFTPERKCMSIIVRPKTKDANFPAEFASDTTKKEKPFARLYIKGADDKILPLLSQSLSHSLSFSLALSLTHSLSLSFSQTHILSVFLHIYTILSRLIDEIFYFDL
jgi:magnesium-transporting ATPase (P-type)